MTKTNQTSEDVKHLENQLAQKWISVISIAAILAIGVWMAVSNVAPEDSAIQKRSVSFIKDIWSLEAGIVIIVLSLVLLYFPVKKILLLSGKTWVKWKSGFYLFDKKKRVQGLISMYNGNDLIVFRPQKDEVLRFENYHKAKLAKYFKAEVTNDYNCKGAYWSPDENGFTLYYQGKSISDTNSKMEGDTLVVTSPESNVIFKLEDYKSKERYKIFKAEVVA